MRILTFTSLFPNASQPLLGVFVQQRMSHFAKRPGNSVTVVAPVPYFPSWLPSARWKKFGRVPGQEIIGDLKIHHPRYLMLPGVSMPLQGYSMFSASLSLVRRLHKETPFDCIDAHYVYPDGFAGVMLGKRLGIPVIVSARGTDMNLFPSFTLIRPMIRWTLENAAGTVGVCETLKGEMIALGAAENRSAAIGNGIDLERFTPVDRQEARNRLGIPADSKVIVSGGGLFARKGYHLLIPAFAELARKNPNLRLYIVGEGESRGQLESLARENGVHELVSLVGSKPNDELKYWFSAADVSCLASSREGWANVLLESLACGTPVVATRVWGAPEVITSPDLGFLVDGSVGSIAAGLGLALHKRWNREALARYAASRTWDVVASEVENFLKLQIRSESKQRPEASAVQSDSEV